MPVTQVDHKVRHWLMWLIKKVYQKLPHPPGPEGSRISVMAGMYIMIHEDGVHIYTENKEALIGHCHFFSDTGQAVFIGGVVDDWAEGIETHMEARA